MEKNDLIFSKKIDSVNIYLAPRDYCGYILLMNCGRLSKKNNCKSITVIVDKAVRILIYTSKGIKKGE
jgi:hypothetical protein